MRVFSAMLYAWLRGGLRLALGLAVVAALWGTAAGSQRLNVAPQSRGPALSQAASVSVSSGVSTSWEEPRKAPKDRHALGHALPPPPAELSFAAGPRWASVRLSQVSCPRTISLLRAERSAVPEPRAPPLG